MYQKVDAAGSEQVEYLQRNLTGNLDDNLILSFVCVFGPLFGWVNFSDTITSPYPLDLCNEYLEQQVARINSEEYMAMLGLTVLSLSLEEQSEDQYKAKLQMTDQRKPGVITFQFSDVTAHGQGVNDLTNRQRNDLAEYFTSLGLPDAAKQSLFQNMWITTFMILAEIRYKLEG